MANTASHREEHQAKTESKKPTPSIEERPAVRSSLSTRDPGQGRSSSHGLMRRFSQDMDRLFGNLFGISPWADRPFDFGEFSGWPAVEVYRRDNKLVVHADVPGLKKEDVTIEVRNDHELCISGERRQETERSERDYYRSERTYGTFCRTILLPEGAKVDTASATFQNGVLEIEIEVPQQTSGSRKIEIREASSH